MDLNQAIAERRSVRAYTPEALDRQTILRLIDAAAQAPSAVNQQPWTFTVVRDQAILDQVSREAKVHMQQTLEPGPGSDHFRSLLADAGFHIFYHAPALVLISAEKQGPWAVENCTLAAENLMLACCASGLGSCWIGFAQGFLNTQRGKDLLGLPASWVAVAPIIIGHPAVEPGPVPRKQPQVHWVG
jgi:nitroreductase